MPENSTFPGLDSSNPDESVTRTYDWAIKKAEEEIEWYQTKRKAKAGFSRLLRILSIVLGAFAAVCPLIGTIQIGGAQIQLTQYGYVAIAIAAALVALDRLFGFSSGWMRYMTTDLSLQRIVMEFQYDWMSLNAQPSDVQTAKPDILMLIGRLKQFSLAVSDAVRVETDAWVQEFQSNLAEMEKTLQAQLETRRAELEQTLTAREEAQKASEEAKRNGAVKVTVSNAREFKLVSILLNDEPCKELAGVTKGLIPAIPPGDYEIRATAKKDNKEISDADVIKVQAGETTSVKLTMPSP